MENREYHIPVLLDESVGGLNIKPGGVYVDVTFGGGGHSKKVLENLNADGLLIAFDQDEEARQNLIDDPRFLFVPTNFRYMKNHLRMSRKIPVDGILADLGVSSHQFDSAERGFSIRNNARLDMRMDKKNPLDAYVVVNKYEEQDLVKVFKMYGELKNARSITKKILASREDEEIKTTTDLMNLLTPFARRGKENKFFAQVFQALRIEVNAEMKALEEMLLQTTDVLKQGGRLVVISYHSLEDRMVKNFMRTGKIHGELEKDFYGNPIRPFKQLASKPIVPDENEIENNSRARSAKLRIAERI